VVDDGISGVLDLSVLTALLSVFARFIYTISFAVVGVLTYFLKNCFWRAAGENFEEGG